MKSLSFLTIVGLLLAADSLLAETVNVKPGQSLQEAADKLQPGDTLLLAGGTYYQSLVLAKSGTPGNPITIKAQVPGKVTITGAVATGQSWGRTSG